MPDNSRVLSVGFENWRIISAPAEIMRGGVMIAASAADSSSLGGP
jgi:hypothetical protein